MKRYIYADNAATTKLDVEAFEAMKPFMLEEYGNTSQPYSFSRTSKKALGEARDQIAKCIGADADEIYFTSGGTESDNWAIKRFCATREIVTTEFEHHAVLNACNEMNEEGYAVKYIRPNQRGIIELDQVKHIVSEETGLVSIMYANNEIGTIQGIARLADIAHGCGANMHTDAVQAVGHVDIDVHQMKVDLLSASAHKFNGPKGIGFLYIKKGTDGSPLLNGGAQENEMRAGTENVAAIVGMSVALKNNVNELEANQERLKKLEDRLCSRLRESGRSFCRNGEGEHLPGLISLSFPGQSGESMLHRLDLMGVAVSTGSACDGAKDEISHVLKSIQLDEIAAKGTIRISLGKYNTEDDVDDIVKAIKKIIDA